MDSSLPGSVGGYTVERRLGRGGMATVYLGVDAELGRQVAIKVIQSEIDSDDARERFTREARSVAALNHPNIVTLYHSGQTDARPYFVMEYIDGGTLKDVIAQRDAVPLERRLRWLEELCDGLQFAHDRGIVHRDIKPANLMIDHLDRLRIVDFGIARLSGTAHTQMSGLIGTAAYMAPEYIRDQETSPQSDIFAAGAVAYEVLTYAQAFPGRTEATILQSVLEKEPAPMAGSDATGLDADIDQFVRRALRKLPQERFASAAEMGAAIGAVRARLGTGHPVVAVTGAVMPPPAGESLPPTMVFDRPARVDPAKPVAPPRHAAPPAPARSSFGYAVAASALLAVAAGGLLWYLLTPAPGRESAATPTGGSESLTRTILTTPRPSTPTGPSSSSTSGTPDSQTAPVPGFAAAPGSRSSAETPTLVAPTPAALAPVPIVTPSPEIATAPVSVAASPTALALYNNAGASPPTNLGLAYRVLRRSENIALSVDPGSTVFQTGVDRIRFSFRPNMDGFLYVAQEGTSGVWEVLFPDPRINGGRNEVKAFEEYSIPGDDWFRLDPPAGTDRLFVYLSKTRVGSLQELNRPVTQHQTLVQASIDHLTGTIARRNLAFERAPATPGSGRESGQAVFVVHRDMLGDAVTVTFDIIHK
ncbi:MAG: protein kinase [Vicinamibacterales bacterium]